MRLCNAINFKASILPLLSTVFNVKLITVRSSSTQSSMHTCILSRLSQGDSLSDRSDKLFNIFSTALFLSLRCTSRLLSLHLFVPARVSEVSATATASEHSLSQLRRASLLQVFLPVALDQPSAFLSLQRAQFRILLCGQPLQSDEISLLRLDLPAHTNAVTSCKSAT